MQKVGAPCDKALDSVAGDTAQLSVRSGRPYVAVAVADLLLSTQKDQHPLHKFAAAFSPAVVLAATHIML
jgi:hypothetical protein